MPVPPIDIHRSPFHPRPWHHGSVFGAGRRVPLDRERRTRFKFLANAHKLSGRLPDKQFRVAEVLLRRLSVDGRCDPSHATLAADAGISLSTVRRATITMRTLGLLQWDRRLVRNGWRTEQTSNAYELVPAAGTISPVLPRVSCGVQIDRATFKKDSGTAEQHPDARVDAARQLIALGFPVPAGWPLA